MLNLEFWVTGTPKTQSKAGQLSLELGQAPRPVGFYLSYGEGQTILTPLRGLRVIFLPHLVKE